MNESEQETTKVPSQDDTFIAPNNLTNKVTDEFSEFERMKASAPPLNYKTPEWSSTLNSKIYFEVLRNGLLIESLKVPTKEFIVFGRLPICDFELQHGSISRYHAVIQADDKGNTFLYDLGSAHGTRVNKDLIMVKTYTKLKSGDQIRFGESSRIYLFFNPDDNLPHVSSDSASLKQITEDPSLKISQESNNSKEPYYFADPKKALFNFMDNLGLAINYELEEEGQSHCKIYNARIRVPCGDILIDSEQAIYGRGTSSTKRDAERLASLDACKQLDSYGILNNDSGKEARAMKKKLKYLLGDKNESDDDSYYDRAGEAEKARRLNKKASKKSKVETFETLSVRRTELEAKINLLSEQAQKNVQPVNQNNDNSEDIDDYILSLKTEETKKSNTQTEIEITKLNQELKKIMKLIEITAPPDAYISKFIPTTKPIPLVKESAPAVTITPEPKETPLPPSDNITSNPKETDILSVAKITPDTNTSADSEDHASNKQVKSELPPSKDEFEEEFEEDDAWVPPQGQTGDGVTHLNAKFGY